MVAHTFLPGGRQTGLQVMAMLCLLVPCVVCAQSPRDRRPLINDLLPYGQEPIDYFADTSQNAVVQLQSRIAGGQAKLYHSGQSAYLRALLQALDVPIESQLLVFSKTARNQPLIGPKTPRAIYFNDEVAVAWVPGAAELEVAAVDPLKGVMFYVLGQRPARDRSDDRGPHPEFRRRRDCLGCHIGQTTIRVPGFMLRSFITDATGRPLSVDSQVAGREGSAELANSRVESRADSENAAHDRSLITHETAIAMRWGGWYVTGKHGALTHQGNLIGNADIERQRREPNFAGNRLDLTSYFDATPYLSAHSDIVAQLVLNHQVHGQNLLIRVGYEARLQRRSGAEAELLRYLLFVNESALAGPIQGTSGYSDWFQRQGPHDHRGHSLRELDLQSRVFRYRLSYLIHSRLFDGLPRAVRLRLYRRLWDILQGVDRTADFKHLTADERRVIVQILRETKSDLPSYWAEKR